MPVIARPRPADDARAEPRQHLGELAMVQHAVLETEIAGLGAHLLHHRAAFFEFLVAEAELDAAVAFVPDIDPGALAELRGKAWPLLGREPAPALIVRRAQAFALHPDKAEIAARGA